jgi:sugar phosphate isomerase/epimerase
VSTPRLSVQLYSVRDALTADLPGTLARIAALGTSNVELYDFVRRAPELSAALRDAGLAAPTGHATLVSDGAPALSETFAAAAEAGVGVVVDPFVAPERWADVDEIARTAERLNEASVEAAAHGLRVGYHNHAHEFAHSFDEESAYDVFAAQLDPAVVLELDAYWAAVGGQDVPALVERLGDRVGALHVKDGPVRGEPGEDPDALTDRQLPAGRGEVPLDAVLVAAPALEFAIVEFDRYAGDVFDGIGEGIRFLQERGIR